MPDSGVYSNFWDGWYSIITSTVTKTLIGPLYLHFVPVNKKLNLNSTLIIQKTFSLEIFKLISPKYYYCDTWLQPKQ